MFQVVNISNLLNPFGKAFAKFEVEEGLRGRGTKALVTGQHLLKLKKQEIRPLSVDNIANQYCPTGRDTYIQKGKNRPKERNRRGAESTRGFPRNAGIIGEEFFVDILQAKGIKSDSYRKLQEAGDSYTSAFFKRKAVFLDQLKKDSPKDYDVFVSGLRLSGRVEFGIKHLYSVLTRNRTIRPSDILFDKEFMPTLQLGISTPSKPDFVIPSLNLIGDVKSGESLEQKHLLTCAGYALAYESSERKPIDWGMIYFFKAKNYTEYGKQISLPQVYLLPIDRELREWFLEIRNERYAIIMKDNMPELPSDTQKCNDCKYRSYCQKDGLVLQ